MASEKNISRAGAIVVCAEHATVRQALELKAAKGLCRGRLLLEGLRLNRAAVRARIRFDAVLYAPELFDGGACAELVDLAARRRVQTVQVSRPLFSRISYKAEGIVGIVRYEAPRLGEIETQWPSAPRLVILDGLSDPGNIGGIIRSANALEATAVVVVDPGRRLYHPKALRSSMGALFHTPTLIGPRATAVSFARRLDVPLVALSPAGTVPLGQLPLGQGFAVVVGNEKRGLHPAWISAAQLLGSVPMFGAVDSLNVTTTASLALYEALCQRQRRLQLQRPECGAGDGAEEIG